MSIPNFFCVSVLFPSLSDYSFISSMELTQKIFHLLVIFLLHPEKVQLVFLHRCFSFCIVSKQCSAISHPCLRLSPLCECSRTCIHLLCDHLHIQQTCMFFFSHLTWISSFCFHVWQSLPFLQMFSSSSCILHPPHRTMCEGDLFFLALPLCYPVLLLWK